MLLTIALAAMAVLDPPPKAKVELLAETAALVAGETNTLALHFRIDKEWHLYYAGQNDTGFPPTIESATLPEGFTLGPIQWPVPTRHVSNGDLLDHIYENEVTLLLPMRVPVDATGPATISLTLDWLVCKEVCLMGGQTVTLTLPVSKDRTQAEAAREVFARARQAMPRPASEAEAHVGMKWDNGRLVLSARPRATGEGDGDKRLPARVEFYPSADSVPIVDLLHAAVSEAGEITLEIGETAGSVRGMLAIFPRPKDQPIVFTVDRAVPVRGNSEPTRSSDQQPSSGR